MRVLLEAAEVRVVGGLIRSVRSGGRHYRVLETLERYEAGGRWWRGDLPRSYYLLLAQGGVRLEVFVVAGLEWTLSAVED